MPAPPEMEAAGTLGEYLRAAQGHDLYQAVVNYSSLSAYGAIEDGTVIPEGGWIPRFTSGEFNNVPVILGANEYEQKSFMPLYGGARSEEHTSELQSRPHLVC